MNSIRRTQTLLRAAWALRHSTIRMDLRDAPKTGILTLVRQIVDQDRRGSSHKAASTELVAVDNSPIAIGKRKRHLLLQVGSPRLALP
jgi:hypothetical protein